MAGRIRASVRKREFTATPIPAELLHISLLNFGRWPGVCAEIVSAAYMTAASLRFPSFEIRLDAGLSFRNRSKATHPFVLTGDSGTEGIRAFQRILRDHFSKAGFPVGRPELLTPYLTLLYDRKLIPKHRLEPPLSWTARDFVLIRSHIGESRYDIAGRWPLTPSDSGLDLA